MEHAVVLGKLNECLKDIFSFSLSRLYDKQEAEDLTNDIIVEVLASADRLQNDEAFYGYMWKIAENTFKKFIRRKKTADVEYAENFVGVCWDTPLDKITEDEEITLLRRELSLLAKQYRDVTIQFYIENKSCPVIAKELGISEEMVKYYLFKTRKILKEGVTMNRQYGEKSYNPSKFGIDFYGIGSKNAYIWETFERKLPGNIVLAAYENPLTLDELSLELGVSVPYLEDEIDILLKYNFIKQVGNKYQTDFPIFTMPYEEDFRASVPTTEICSEAAIRITQAVETLFPKFRQYDFGIEMNDNQLRWFMTNLAFFYTLDRFETATKKRFGDYPKLNATSYGFVYGHDNDYQYGFFAGIYGHCGSEETWFRAVNYNIIRNCQLWRGINATREITICDAILQKPLTEQNEETVAQLVAEGFITTKDRILKANFPVFTSTQGTEMAGQLKEIIQLTAECMEKICEMACEIFNKHMPKYFRNRYDHLCYVRHATDTIGIIMEKLVADQFLFVPKERTNLCMYGVRKVAE